MRQLLFFPAILLGIFSQAQITITSADMPVAGDTFYSARDTMPTGFSIGLAGANRSWDFSNLNPDVQQTTYSVTPASTPYGADFPNANLALTNDFSAYLYYRNITSALKAEGFANNDPNLGVVSVNFNPIPDQYQFPATYLTKFSGNSGFQEAKPYSQLPPNIQAQIDAGLAACFNPNAQVFQVRVTFTSSYTDTIDAWGTVTTPVGTYDALRRKRVENTHTVIEAETNCFFTTSWIALVDTTGTTTEHSWLSNITKLPLVTLGYDDQRNVNAVTYSLTPPPPVAGFTWTNPSGGQVNFTNTSQNSPTLFNWDFGDGASSSSQHPAPHVYSANGSYYACLTVTNSSGSDSFCDSVHVTGISPVNNPPVAMRDSAQIVYPASATINLLANDFDPDGDNIVFNFFFQPFNGTLTNLGNGMIEYEANSNFRGIDSFEYKISDDGNPVLSDTGTVVIKVDGLPAADFTFSGNGLTVQFANASSGYDNIHWDLGDGDTANTNTVVHTYANAGTYTACLTAENAFGEDSVCKSVTVPVTGIAGVDDASITIYPNPTDSELRIEAGNWHLQKIELLDLNGKILNTQHATPNTQHPTLYLAALPRGFYLCKLTGSDGHVVVKKVLRN